MKEYICKEDIVNIFSKLERVSRARLEEANEENWEDDSAYWQARINILAKCLDLINDLPVKSIE